MKLRELTYDESLELGGLENRIIALVNQRYHNLDGWLKQRSNQITERGLVMITKLARRENDKDLINAMGKYLIKRLEFKYKDK